MSNDSIPAGGTYTLSTPLTNGTNIEFLNNGADTGVLILTDLPQGTAFNITTSTVSGTISSYGANIGGSVLNFQPGNFGIGGDQVTIQVIKDLFAALFVGGTANADYQSLISDITTAAQNGNQILLLPNGTIQTTVETPFTLDAAQEAVILQTALAVFGTGATSATLDLAFTDVRVNPNNNSHFIDGVFTAETAVNEVNPCFAAGTRILTAHGEIPVENLAVGDVVITHAGEEQPIIWLGRRRIDLMAHPDPASVRPIIIEPGALSDHTPARRLLVSPDHAFLIDGVLVPAKELVNATSIRQDVSATAITYFHIELAQHDVIFAEGAAAETFLDTGHRGAFDNAASQITLPMAAMQTRREAESAAPLCLGGAQLAAIRQRLAARDLGVRLG